MMAEWHTPRNTTIPLPNKIYKTPVVISKADEAAAENLIVEDAAVDVEVETAGAVVARDLVVLDARADVDVVAITIVRLDSILRAATFTTRMAEQHRIRTSTMTTVMPSFFWIT